MARKRRDVVTGMVCAGALILLAGVGVLVYQIGLTFTMKVCSKSAILTLQDRVVERAGDGG